MDIVYRRAIREELDLAVSWAAAEGWNPGCGDADVYWETDPESFVALECDGALVGAGSVMSYGGAFGFMGFYIMRKDMRGKGLGGAFWRWRKEQMIERLEPGAAFGMDGVTHMEPFYARGGFVTSHYNLRMAGVVGRGETGPELVPAGEVPWPLLLDFDQRHFGFNRDVFLHGWLHRPDTLALATMRNGEIRGYGAIRPSHDGFRIGPLFSETNEDAERLFAALGHQAGGKEVCIDMPANNPYAMRLARTYRLREVFRTARMYQGPPPPLRYQSIYGVTTLELG